MKRFSNLLAACLISMLCLSGAATANDAVSGKGCADGSILGADPILVADAAREGASGYVNPCALEGAVPCGGRCCPPGMRCGDSKCYPRDPKGAKQLRDPVGTR